MTDFAPTASAETPTIEQMPTPAAPRLLRESTLYFAGNVISRLTGLLMIRFYSSYLTAGEYGILNLVEISISIVAFVFGLQSIGQTLTRIYNDQQGEAARREVVSTALLASIILTGAIAGVAALAAGPIAAGVGLPGYEGLIRVGFGAMFFGTLAEVVLVYMRMQGRAGFFLAFSMITMLASIALNVWFIGFLHYGVWGFVSSKLIVAGSGSLLLLIMAFREVGLAWRASYASALVRFGLPLTISGASYYAIHMSDRLFLSHVSKADVGVYSLAYNFAFLLSILVTDSFNKSWEVSFYALAAQPGWQVRFARMCRWLVLVMGAAALGISMFGRDLLTLLAPPSYYPPVLLLPVLVFGYFFRGIGDFFRDILLIGIGSGKVGRIAIGCACLNIALNFWFIPRYGIWGAAWCTFATWVVYCGVCWVGAYRTHQVVFRLMPVVQILAMAAVALFAFTQVRPSWVLLRLIVDSALLAAFLAATAVFYLGREDRREAWAFLRGIWEKISGSRTSA